MGFLKTYLEQRKREQGNSSSPGTSSNEPSSGFSSEEQPEEFLKRCRTQEYFEETENREWDSDPSFKDILNPLNAQDNGAAITACRRLMGAYSDLDLIFKWLGTALLRQNNCADAQSVVIEGLKKSKRKYSLCNCAGEIAWKSGRLKEALYWWAQGLHCQMSLPDYGGSIDSFLYLHYLAIGFDRQEAVLSFIQMADMIRPGKIRLNMESSGSLIKLAREGKSELLCEALAALHEKYFCKKAETVDENEFQKMIKNALDRDASYEQRKKAIDALGEIGDGRAIDYLQNICDNEIGMEGLDARAAIDKILRR